MEGDKAVVVVVVVVVSHVDALSTVVVVSNLGFVVHAVATLSAVCSLS